MRIKWTSFAVDQLNAAIDNVLDRQGALGARAAANRILDRVAVLSTLPRSAPAWRPAGDESYRRLVTDDYVILYRISESDGTVFVLAIRHGRQRPLQPTEVPEK